MPFPLFFLQFLTLLRMASSSATADYYRILEVPRNSDIATIKASYKWLAKLRHPDKEQVYIVRTSVLIAVMLMLALAVAVCIPDIIRNRIHGLPYLPAGFLTIAQAARGRGGSTNWKDIVSGTESSRDNLTLRLLCLVLITRIRDTSDWHYPSYQSIGEPSKGSSISCDPKSLWRGGDTIIPLFVDVGTCCLQPVCPGTAPPVSSLENCLHVCCLLLAPLI